jgi:probable HAF family extracellular repeat protein
MSPIRNPFGEHVSVRREAVATLAALGAVVVLCGLVAGARAATSAWTSTQIGGPGFSALAVNDAGTVAGYVGVYPDYHAAVWSGGTTTLLSTPENTIRSLAVGVNAAGDVAGGIDVQLESGDIRQEAVVWDAGGEMTRLGFLPGGTFSVGQDINDNGWVVGVAGADGHYHGFLWDGDGPIEALPTPAGTTDAYAVAINTLGDVVGSASAMSEPPRAVLWKGGAATTLDPLAAGAAASATDINDFGQIVGNSTTTAPPWVARNPVLWQDGTVIDLGSLGGAFGVAQAVNDHGQVVGLMTDDANVNHAFVWQDAVRAILDPLPGDVASVAADINDASRIVGSSTDETGTWRAVMWSPAPQVSVTGHGRFNTDGNGQVVFTLSNEEVRFDRTRGQRFSFTGEVESVTGEEKNATLTGTGTWNGQAAYTFEASVVDKGGWGRLEDTISVVIRDPAGALAFTSFGPQVLKQGDISVVPADPA